jgi:hypothetical protein
MCRKGIRINIPEPSIGYYYGNVNEHRDVSRCPRKSFLFFLTFEHASSEFFYREKTSRSRQSSLIFETIRFSHYAP